jgi:glycosyltransferase involved in cell wall biosynthesis
MIAYSLYDGDARIRREAETLVSTGRYEVVVLTLKNGKSTHPYVLDGVQIQPLNIEKYRGKNPLKYILSYLAFTLRAFVAVTRFARASAVDVVHVHNMPNFLLLAALIPLAQRKPVILDIHDTMPETFAATFSPRLRRIALLVLGIEERLCVALAARVITVNDIQREAVLGRQPRARLKAIVSMNVPDPRLFGCAASSARGSSSTDKFRLVYHGTVSGRLNVGLAVEAVARCAASVEEIELHIIGEGDARLELMRTCQARQLGSHVVFHDRVPFDRLIPVIRGMDVGIVPLQSNPATDLMLPVKLMECLALGVPVVAPRLKAIKHYFDERLLFFFQPGDLESLMAAIIEAHNPRERAQRLASAQSFLDKYRWDVQKANLLDLYDGLHEDVRAADSVRAEERPSLAVQKSSKQ